MTDTRDLPGFTIKLGPMTITWASLFYAKIRYTPRSVTGTRVPLFERPDIQENEEPYRAGHARVLRLWPTCRALILGWWGDPAIDDTVGESRALALLVGEGTRQVAAGMPVTQLLGMATAEEVEERAAARADAETGGVDLDEDFQIIDLRNEAPAG